MVQSPHPTTPPTRAAEVHQYEQDKASPLSSLAGHSSLERAGLCWKARWLSSKSKMEAEEQEEEEEEEEEEVRAGPQGGR